LAFAVAFARAGLGAAGFGWAGLGCADLGCAVDFVPPPDLGRAGASTPPRPRTSRGVRYRARLAMPKMKSHSGASKRFKKTASGKLRGRHAYSSHILEKKSPKRKRAFRKDREISSADRKTVRKLLEGSGR